MPRLPLQHLITLLLLLIFLRLGVLGEVLHKLALSRWEIQYGMLALILCSLVNLRLCRLRLPRARADEEPDQPARVTLGSNLRPGRLRLPRARADEEPDQPARVTLGINLGGAIVPLFIGLYLGREQMPEPLPLLLLCALVALVVYPLSRISARRGVVIHLAGAILVAALGAVWLGGRHYLLWAYWAAVLGTLIGGDLLHLSQLLRRRRARRHGVFIGGAGLMDAIFLSGLFAMLTAELLQQHDLLSSLPG